MGRNPSSLFKLNIAAGTPCMRVPAMGRIWLQPVRPSTGALSDVVLAGQSETVAKEPAREHQRRDRGKPARQPDPDADAFPVGRKSQPSPDAEANYPIADKRKQKRPARIVEATQHAGANDLRA